MSPILTVILIIIFALFYQYQNLFNIPLNNHQRQIFLAKMTNISMFSEHILNQRYFTSNLPIEKSLTSHY